MTRQRNSSGLVGLSVCVLIGAGLAAKHEAGHPAGHHQAAATLTSIPTGGRYTPESWARTLLRIDGFPRTPCRVAAITAWANSEGGNWANTATYNPLNTTQPEPGSKSMNSVNVQAYRTWRSGFRATVATLGNGRYTAVIAALQAGGGQPVADAVAASPWGTGPFQVTC